MKWLRGFSRWFSKLFWQRCYYCKEKKPLFFYTWELPDFDKYNPDEDEICTDCARKSIVTEK
jgi:hypothetical protein